MRKFELDNGEKVVFEAESPSAVLDIMREQCFYDDEDENDFLRSRALSNTSWSGHTIRYDSREVFAQDLMSAGLLREITNETTDKQ